VLRKPFLIALLATTLPAAAHETWLLPDDFAPEPGAELSFAMASGMGFPSDGAGIAPDRIVAAGVIHGVTSTPLEPAEERFEALELRGTAGPGVQCVHVRLAPRTLELDGDVVPAYLDEIGAGPGLHDLWRTSPVPSRWRETYAKGAKAYLRAGPDPEGAEPCWKRPLGHPFELVPDVDPTALRAGDDLVLTVLLDGAPVAGQALGLVRADGERGPLRRTDRFGRIRLRIPEAGAYLVYGTHLRRVGAEWESDFATLTFEAR
jgi:hypothetical protein